jgi:hypothetical protein
MSDTGLWKYQGTGEKKGSYVSFEFVQISDASGKATNVERKTTWFFPSNQVDSNIQYFEENLKSRNDLIRILQVNYGKGSRVHSFEIKEIST